MDKDTCLQCNNSIKNANKAIVCCLTGKIIFNAETGEENKDTCMAYND